MGSGSYVKKVAIGSRPLFRHGRPPLETLDLELTERCNQQCVHCCINLPAGDRAAAARELSTEAWLDLLHQAASLGCLSVRFTGGEPLLREDLEVLYEEARRLGMQAVLATNATRLRPSMAELLERIPPRAPVEVSVYGPTRTSYEAVTRQPGSWEAFQQGIALLVEHGIGFLLKAPLLSTDLEVEALQDWAGNLPVDRPPGRALVLELRRRHDSEQADRRIRSLRLSSDQYAAILPRLGEDYLKDLSGVCRSALGPLGPKLFDCGAGRNAAVDAYGVFKPCLGMGHPDMASDLLQCSLGEAVKRFQAQWKEVESDNPEYLEQCARCFLSGICHQCPARSWGETGELDRPVPYLCGVAHAQAVHLGLLSPHERAWEIGDWQERVQKRFSS